MKTKLLDFGCRPTKADEGSACWDLYAKISVTKMIYPEEVVKIPLGIAVEIPKGHVGLLYSRSGHGKNGVRLGNCVGVIDSSYRGEVCALVTADGASYTVKPYEKIAQFMVIKHEELELELVDHLSRTDRGSGGFGSSGK